MIKKSSTSTQIIAKEGWISIGTLYVLFLLFVSLELELLSFLAIVLLFFIIAFFRNPERTPDDKDRKAIITPIDGKITAIQNCDNKTTITIKNTLFDTHFLRAPIDGEANSIKHINGLSTSHKALAKNINEQLHLCIGSIDITAISHHFQNPTLLYNTEEVKMLAGERIGFLRCGEVSISFPHTPLRVSVGDKVLSGRSTLAFLA